MKAFIEWPLWARALTWLYIGVYWVRLFAIGIFVWGRFDSFYDWWMYVVFQMIYGIIWPVWYLLPLFGVRS